MKLLLGLIASVFLLSSCAVHTRDGSVIVDPHRSNGNFCPPGQAKKGNC